MLAELRAGVGGARGQSPHEARGLEGPVVGMDDPAVEAPREMARQVVDPLGREPVLMERLVFGADLLALLGVGGQPEAAVPDERVACELCHPVERSLRPPPELARLVDAVGLAGDVVARGAAAKREAAVPPARPLGDAALIVDANAQPRLGEAER